MKLIFLEFKKKILKKLIIYNWYLKTNFITLVIENEEKIKKEKKIEIEIQR